MSLIDIFVIVGIVIICLIFFGWYTVKKFNSIESGETNRRKHIDEDMQVQENEESDKS